MILLIIAIVIFYALIPVFKTMEMKRPTTLASLFQGFKSGFKSDPDVETQSFQLELDQLTGTLRRQRGLLAALPAGTMEQETLRMSLEETRNSIVRLVRKFEVDMSDEHYERIIHLVSTENDPAGTSTRMIKETQGAKGAVRMMSSRAIG